MNKELHVSEKRLSANNELNFKDDITVLKTAIVTGASSGIGLSISKKLLNIGYKVYGLSRNIEELNFSHENLIKLPCDLTNTSMLEKVIRNLRENEKEIHILVNNAGIGYFGPHEQIQTKHISQMVSTNLLAPLILTNLLMRDLRKTKGYIINISSITAKKSSTHGAAYAATKSGLSHFAASLFDETRKSGIKVVTLHPDMTKTNFYNHSDFKEGSDPESYISPETISDALEYILNQPEGTVISDITLRPQKHMINKSAIK